MFCVLDSLTHGIRFTSPKGDIHYKLSGVGFVDDVTLGCSDEITIMDNDEVVEIDNERNLHFEVTNNSRNTLGHEVGSIRTEGDSYSK